MAIYPKAVRKLIPPDARDPLIDPDLVVLHVDAGNASSLYDWWKVSGTLECHFFVKKDGAVEQYVDTRYQADAQVGGASHAISIETQGYDSGEWTDEQMASLKALLLWLHVSEKIPLRVPADPYDGGVGYHSMWPSSREGTWARDGRTCPGAGRIRQYRTDLVPWMRDPQEDDMPLTDADIERIWAHKVTLPDGNGDREAGRVLGGANLYAYRASRGIVDVPKLAAAVIASLPAGGAVNVDALAKAIVVELGKD